MGSYPVLTCFSYFSLKPVGKMMPFYLSLIFINVEIA